VSQVLGDEKLATNIQKIDAPPVDTTPLKETTPGYIPMTFPTLSPDGASDFHQARLRKVELGEYFNHLLRFRGGHFAQHPWFSFNTLQRSRARCQSKIFIKQQHDAARLTAEDIQAMVAESDQKLALTIIRYGKQLWGTRACWLARQQHEVMDMTRDPNRLNSPHLFFTLSIYDIMTKYTWNGGRQEIPLTLF
jgi:hypothetical protein